MSKYPNLKDILNTLPAFECASRLLSITKAADEMCLSQPALSRKISNLESRLGTTVFERKHNKIELTPAGKKILSAVELSLSHLDNAIGELNQGREKDKLTIACGFSFASMWLQPRFSKLRNSMTKTELHLIASENLEDLDPDTIDIRILWKNEPWPDRVIRPLFSQHLFPVCSRSFANLHNIHPDDKNLLKKLATLPLIKHDSSLFEDVSWEDWFKHHNANYVENESSYKFDNTQYMIQSALDSEGVALSHYYLISQFLESGDLIQIGPIMHGADYASWIEFNSYRMDEDTIEKVFSWFALEAEYNYDTKSPQ